MTEIIDHNSPDFFCSLQSRSFEENPLGTAPSAKIWFMLEYNGRWGSKAFEESSIPDNVKSGVTSQLDQIEKSRLLLIKQKSDKQPSLTFFAALADVNPPQLYRFELSDYSDLLNINLVGLAKGVKRYEENVVSEPLFLVCTNGLRDKCCARNGVPAFQALSDEFGEIIWQSTHHGGHRFSANMLAMPYGLSYGRMDLGESSDTVKAFLRNEMPLENLRGRSSYAKMDQAAEALLRSQIGSKDPNGLHLVSSYALNDENWKVIFETSDKNLQYSVGVNRKTTDTLAYISCIGDKQAPVVKYSYLEHAII
jgi:hypothetical protein